MRGNAEVRSVEYRVGSVYKVCKRTDVEYHFPSTFSRTTHIASPRSKKNVLVSDRSIDPIPALRAMCAW